MSVSDPLLKKLKAFVIGLRTQEEAVDDNNQLLKPLCDTLEQIVLKGLKTSSSWFGSGKTQYWAWIVKLPTLPSLDRLSPLLSMPISTVKKCKKVQSDLGRGRFFLRIALVKKCLTTLIQVLVKNPQLSSTWYCERGSILGNDILTEIFLSLLLELQEVSFKLQLKNCCFLDMTWELPVFKQYELVPCDDLGLDIRTIKGYPIVTQVDNTTVAAEDDKVMVGDVLDEMCGECLRGVGKSGVYYIFHQNEGKPIQLNVIKGQDKDGALYSPIGRLLERANLGDISPTTPTSPGGRPSWLEDYKPPPEAILPENIEDEVPVHDSETCAVYDTVYLGKSYLGKDGRVNMVEQGVGEVLKRSKNKQHVTLELGEKDVTIIDKDTKQTLVKHIYTEISACGRRTDALLYYAYIAGETYCSLATEFYCHVFEATSEDQAKTILCTIAQGFERTHLMT